LQATLRDCYCACFPATESTVPISQNTGRSEGRAGGADEGGGVVRLAGNASRLLRRLSELHRSTVPASKNTVRSEGRAGGADEGGDQSGERPYPTNVGPSGAVQHRTSARAERFNAGRTSARAERFNAGRTSARAAVVQHNQERGTSGRRRRRSRPQARETVSDERRPERSGSTQDELEEATQEAG